MGPNPNYKPRGSFPLNHHLVGGFFPTHLKNISAVVKLDHETPRIRGENKKYLSCHHLVTPMERIDGKIPNVVKFPRFLCKKIHGFFSVFLEDVEHTKNPDLPPL